jgi:hypothetical protein
MREAHCAMPEDGPRRRFSFYENWRRGWDSHHCCVLKTKNLTVVSFLTIRQIRSKAQLETHIEHVENRVLTGLRSESTFRCVSHRRISKPW